MKNIKILISVFHDTAKSFGDFIIPVSSGAENCPNEKLLKFRDNSGVNISDKNKNYCELTVVYWAWKNLDCDVYGLMHQRRYFNFDNKNLYACDIQRKLPTSYKIFDKPDSKTLEILHTDYKNISALMDRYDIIAPVRENIFESVRTHYNRCDGNSFDDIGLVCDIIKEKFPNYVESAEKYFNGNFAYFCNMFIMNKQIFNDYCYWLFDILDEFEKRKPKKFKQLRECGKIGERLFGVYMTYIINNTDIKWAELPRAHFSEINGVTKNLSFNKTLYRLCPPGSRRRSILRKIKQKG